MIEKNAVDRDDLIQAVILLDALRANLEVLFNDFFDAYDPAADDPRHIAYGFKRAKSHAHAVLYLLRDIERELENNGITL